MKRKKNSGMRGAALVETALVTSLVLMLMFGAVQIALVGFYQMAADGAAFTNAHQIAMIQSIATPSAGQNSAAHTWTQNHILPSAMQGSNTAASEVISAAPTPPGNLDATLQSEFNLSSQSSRHGGFSVLQSTQLAATVQQSNIAGLLTLNGTTGNISVSGVAIEPEFLEMCAHKASSCTDLGVGGNSSTSFTTENNYFTAGENAPPYMAGFHFMKMCVDQTATDNPTQYPNGWAGCQNTEFRALGLATELDAYNWGANDSNNPDADSVYGQTITTAGTGENGAFRDLACHQRKYAAIAAVVYAETSLGVGQLPTLRATFALPLGSDVNNGAAASGFTTLQQIYRWDSLQTSAQVPPDAGVPSSYPLYPSYGCP
jgi:hypothetical protein